MTQPMNARSETVVVYRDADYASVGRRLLIDFIDTAVAGTVAVVLSVIAWMFSQDAAGGLAAVASWVVVWIAYFVLLKGSRFRTLGYVIAGARIVDRTGQRPGYGALLFRLSFVIFGPANFLIDLLWVSTDLSRQALRDKFAHTYVIRNGAAPVGTGRVVYRVYMVFGWTMLFPEVSGS